MDDGTLPRCLWILFFLVLSGILAAAETAYSYCNRIRMKLKAEDGSKAAKRVVNITENFDKAIITLLIGINIAHIVPASMATVLVTQWTGSESFGSVLSTFALTLIVFICCETIPKNIARVNADSFALVFSWPLYWLMKILTPAVFFFNTLAKLVKLLIGSKSNEPSMTEEEFADIVETVEEEGILEPEDSELIQSAIDFSDRVIRDIMTPRNKMIVINLQDPLPDIMNTILTEKYSRIPCTQGDSGKIVGILQVRRYLRDVLRPAGAELSSLLSPVYTVSASRAVHEVFDEMRRRKQHMAIVLDEDGQVEGLVTMEDMLEELVGDIFDEDDPNPVQNEEEEEGKC